MTHRANNQALPYWLALSMMRAGGTVRRALEEGLSSEELFYRVVAERAEAARLLDTAKREIDRALSKGISFVPIDSPLYPDSLRHIHEPPTVLYTLGRVELLTSPSVAVVGTRRASTYGRQMAERFGAGLSGAGITVVSGMARGCDTWAHRGALSRGGNTIAVLGTGIDIAYPKDNRALYEEIKEKGLLVTEFTLSTPPLAKNFPIRNRIISGLARGVVVVEAPLRSGAMMTARLCLEEGREVFALPGRADSQKSGGTNRLIKEGALLVETVEDVLTELFPDHSPATTVEEKQAPKTTADSEEELVFSILEDEPLHIDRIVERSGMPVDRLASVLLTMELKGFVEQRPGKFFVKKTA